MTYVAAWYGYPPDVEPLVWSGLRHLPLVVADMEPDEADALVHLGRVYFGDRTWLRFERLPPGHATGSAYGCYARLMRAAATHFRTRASELDPLIIAESLITDAKIEVDAMDTATPVCCVSPLVIDRLQWVTLNPRVHRVRHSDYRCPTYLPGAR